MTRAIVRIHIIVSTRPQYLQHPHVYYSGSGGSPR